MMYTVDHKREYAFIMAVTVLLITLGIELKFSQKEPDAFVAVATTKGLSQQQMKEIQTALEQYLPDLNQDGESYLKLQNVDFKDDRGDNEFSSLLGSDKNVLFVTDAAAFERLREQESLVVLQDVFTNLPGVEQERFFINHLPQTEWNIPLPGDLTISMKAFESLIGRDNEEISNYYQGQCYFMDNIVSNRKVM